MYAIVAVGSHQYRVEPDTEFTVFRHEGDVGEELELTEVLMVKDDSDLKIGTPQVDGASVKVSIVEHFRGDKITVYNFKKRHGRRRKLGHRDDLTRLRVESIDLA